MGKKTGLYVDYRLYGTGDIGGAPDEKSVSFIANSQWFMLMVFYGK